MLIVPRFSKESARDYAIRMVRENIITLRLMPGSMVSENELAGQLGLSRTPVREALIELGKTGIVEIFPQRGSMISKIDYNLVEQARFIRLVLEKAVIDLACEMATEDDHALLEANLQLQAHYVEHYNPDKLLALDNEFHSLLFVIARQNLAHQMLDSLTAHFDRVRHMSLSAVVSAGALQEEHRAIAQAIRDNNKADAHAVMDKHLSRYSVDKVAIQAAYPQYFK